MQHQRCHVGGGNEPAALHSEACAAALGKVQGDGNARAIGFSVCGGSDAVNPAELVGFVVCVAISARPKVEWLADASVGVDAHRRRSLRLQ
mmetsp:Transcript_43066/g.133083  ORF Transcript_43066/g.133083 Transcript_43066/m.133083 type:complete len:91 (-) Transcript_43066:278-550(-)